MANAITGHGGGATIIGVMAVSLCFHALESLQEFYVTSQKRNLRRPVSRTWGTLKRCRTLKRCQTLKRCHPRMALPAFCRGFHTALISSILATALGFLSKPISFALRLLALGSTRSGRWPTVWLMEVSNASFANTDVLMTQANNQFTASDCSVAVKLKDRGMRFPVAALWSILKRMRL